MKDKDGNMFCPKCGREMKQTERGLKCEFGDMPLSRDLERRLTECYVTKIRQPRELQFSFGVGGKWYCPEDGVLMPEVAKGVVRCPQCRRNFNEFVGALIELHPHRSQ